jgi:membrane associated rhomboid family serine protease
VSSDLEPGSNPYQRAHEAESDTVSLAAPRCDIVLDQAGMRLPLGLRGRRPHAIPYEDITHLVAASRGFWLGTRRGIHMIRRGRFLATDGPELLTRALVQRIGRQPNGLTQLGRIAEVNRLSRQPRAMLATKLLVGVCVAVYFLQLSDPFVLELGALAPRFVREGQLWRIVTANLLHAPIGLHLHIAMNMLGLLGLALIVERPLGSVRALVVIGAAALGSMGASYLADYEEVVGASGIVMGLAGAALCLELHYPERLPVWWRLPRTLFLWVLIVEGVLGFVVPVVAGAAHLGGFVGGYLATLPMARAALVGQPAEPWVRRMAWAVGLVGLLAVAAAAPLVLRSPGALERYGADLLDMPDAETWTCNDLAWRMATESDASFEQLEVALALAERAVAQSDHANPDLLDTLAEVLFLRGDLVGALEAIDTAIYLTRGEPYFVEQRRRFTGERAPDDRPAPPLMPWPYRGLDDGDPAEEPGITI